MKTDNRNWKEKFFEVVPMVDENGKPIPWNPPLNSGFSLKKRSTAGELEKQIELNKKDK